LTIIPSKSRPEHTGIMVVYDLEEPDSWEQAREDRAAQGKELTEIYTLDSNHVAMVFKPGGALEASA
jgi:hypothetical protein